MSSRDFYPEFMKEKVCRLFEVKDVNAEPLAVLPGTDIVTMAHRKVNNAESYYVINSVLTPAVVRAIGKSVGVHFYNQAGDALGANKSYLYVHASRPGNRLIKLPYKADVYDAMTENKLFSNVDEFEDSFMFGQTRTYRISEVK